MTKGIIIAVVCGILSGYFFIARLPFAESYLDVSGNIIIVGLCVLLFFVGMDIGREGTLLTNLKKAGWRIMAFPFAAIAGTFIFTAISSIFLPINMREAMAVGAGFGWYTLAPVLLMGYSTKISAISFLYNVMRELFGIILIPIVAKKIGYIETTALPGVAAADVCVPIVERATSTNIVIYSFVTGMTMGLVIPAVPFIVGM